jgi:hypothetical protein
VREEREALNRYAEVREIGALNPLLARAMKAVQKHVIPELVITEQKTRWETSKTFIQGEGGTRDKIEVTRRVPVVVFRGEMSGNEKGAKWARFIGALKVEPGIAVDDDPLTPRGVAVFRVSLPEPKAEAEGDE